MGPVIQRVRLLLIAIIATASNSVIAGSGDANSAAKIVGPIRVAENIENSTTSAFVSGMTGDLAIHIFGAIISVTDGDKLDPIILALKAAFKSQCVSCGLNRAELGGASATGLLSGNPVRSVDLHPVKLDQTGVLGISVIVAYN